MNNPTTTENNVNFIQQGEGAPVILIHGLAASLFDWNDLLPALTSAGYAAYALDLLGHGKSGKPECLAEYTLENVFGHFCGWLETLALDEPLTLVGHSLGGYLAIEYALRHPQKVCALALVDPFISLEQLPLLLRLNYRKPLVTTTLIEMTPEWLFRRVIDLTSLSIRNGYVLSESVREQTAADYKRAHPGIFNILHTVKDLTPRLPSVSQPALLLWGSQDQTLSPASFPKILEQMPTASGFPIPGAGHVPHQSHAEEFNRRVMAFLQTLDFLQ